MALACAFALAVAAPACARRAPVVAPAAPAPATPPAPLTPRPVHEVAQDLIEQGRATQAAALLDGFLAAAPAAAERGQALELAAYLRLSADPAVRDLAMARDRLAERLGMPPASPRQLEIGATLALLDQTLALQQEVADLRSATEADRLAGEERRTASARDLRQARAEATTLRGEIKTLQEELRKKDEALQKLAATVVSPKPPQ
jgi:hypothetical protein